MLEGNTLLWYPQTSKKFGRLWKHENFFGNIKMFLTYPQVCQCFCQISDNKFQHRQTKQYIFQRREVKKKGINPKQFCRAVPINVTSLVRAFLLLFVRSVDMLVTSDDVHSIYFQNKTVYLPEWDGSFCSSDSWLDPSDPGGDRRPQNLSIIWESAGLYVGRGCGSWGRGSPSDMDSNMFVNGLNILGLSDHIYLNWKSSFTDFFSTDFKDFFQQLCFEVWLIQEKRLKVQTLWLLACAPVHLPLVTG